MKTKSLLSSFVIAIVLAAGLGCAKKLDDAKMSSDIQSKFSQDSGLSTKQLTVQANNGVVTLSGTVDNDAQRDAAGRQAASIPGVKTVINNLQIGDATAAAAPTPAPLPLPLPLRQRRSPVILPKPSPKLEPPRSRRRNGSTGTRSRLAIPLTTPTIRTISSRRPRRWLRMIRRLLREQPCRHLPRM